MDRDVQATSAVAVPRGRLPKLTALLVVTLLALTLAPFGAGAQGSSSRQVYFDGTGQTLGGAFYDGWVMHGGLEQAGSPVSPAVQRGDRWFQWFENARLEVGKPALDQAVGLDVQPAAIGMALAQSFGLTRFHPAFQPPEAAAGDETLAFPNGHLLANGFREAWERQDGETRLGAPISREFQLGLGATIYQFFERGALSWTAEAGVEPVPLGYIDAAVHSNLRLGASRPDGVPSYQSGVANPYPGNSGDRWIDINLSSYRITAYEGDQAVFSSVIVDGAPETPTVTGVFYTYWKLDKQTMQGRNTDGSEYIQEDVPWVMYFYADFAIHGAYWRSSFGYSGSHGCVNVPVADAAWIYAWAPVGTRVEVHY